MGKQYTANFQGIIFRVTGNFWPRLAVKIVSYLVFKLNSITYGRISDSTLLNDKFLNENNNKFFSIN
jgi:hypothetical protein